MTTNRLELAQKSLLGTSIGDAFGESFFGEQSMIKTHIDQKIIPETQWEFTDDTVMSIAIYKSLEKYGVINQDYLAQEFTKNYFLDINRGYGPSMHQYFREIKEGENWRNVSYAKFSGQGSMGNGGAMRATVIGAYFYDDLDILKHQAFLSCEVTHANKEAIEGTKAIALASAFTVCEYLGLESYTQQEFIEKIKKELEDTDMKSKLNKVLHFDSEHHIETLVSVLGNGTKMTTQDTVPIVIWMLSRYRNYFEKGLWESVSALGDRDTICAMFGGVSILGSDNILIEWNNHVENWKNSEFYVED